MLGDDFVPAIEAARDGVDWGWSRIYRDLAPSVLGHLGSRGAAEPAELCGEVFLQVVRDLGRFSGDERDFRAWVFVIAHHRFIDDQRRRSRRPVELRAEVEPRGPDEGVEAEVLRSIAAERIERMIRRLSPDQRDVLLLRVLGGLTVTEVAAAVGKRPGAIKALQRRGIAAIGRALQGEGVSL
jgi:RNA polymerase sigma-70 factor (ECF subfamily)